MKLYYYRMILILDVKVLSYMWWMKPVLKKLCKVAKYYAEDCQNYLLFFTSFIKKLVSSDNLLQNIFGKVKKIN